MGPIECSQPASKSSQDFGDISMMLKMAHFRKSTGPRWVKLNHVSKRSPRCTFEGGTDDRQVARSSAITVTTKFASRIHGTGIWKINAMSPCGVMVSW